MGHGKANTNKISALYLLRMGYRYECTVIESIPINLRARIIGRHIAKPQITYVV